MNDDEEDRMDVKVERELCIGSGYCVRLAPDVFALDEEEIAVVFEPVSADEETLERTAETCPAGAIFLGEEAAGS